MSVLSENNFSVLQAFLRTQVYLERQDEQTPEENENQIKIFHFLLDVDSSALINFMKNNEENTSIISTRISENFSEALRQATESVLLSANF